MGVLVGMVFVPRKNGVKDGKDVQVGIGVEVSLGIKVVVGVLEAGNGNGFMVSVGKVIKVGNGTGGKGFRALFGLKKIVAK